MIHASLQCLGAVECFPCSYQYSVGIVTKERTNVGVMLEEVNNW